MLLIHGLGDGAFVWNGFRSQLLPDQSAFTIDLRGHGDAPRDPARTYGSESFMEDVVSFLDGLETPRVVLVGHSLGAHVAIRSAAARPERVSALVIIEAGLERNERAAVALVGQLKAMRWSYPSVADFAQFLVNRHPFADRAILEAYASSALRPLDDGSFELKADPALCENLPAPDTTALWQAVESLDCPKLIVRGSASSVLPQRTAEQMTQRLANCRLATVRRAGHNIPVDNPAGLHAAISAFLTEAAQ